MTRAMVVALGLTAGAALAGRAILRREVDLLTTDGQRLLLAPWSPEAAELRRQAETLSEAR